MECQRCTLKCERINNAQKYCSYCSRIVKKEQDKIFMEKNKKSIKEYLKEYYQNHKKEYYKNQKWWRDRNPIKRKARYRVKYKKLRSGFCINCGSKENLHFHHIDYEKDDGFTLCRSCHLKIHNQ